MDDMTHARLTVVCVTYNSGPVLSALAATLARFLHVVIVDNGSGDDTVAQIRQQIPHARVIVRPDNAGFGVANNEGLRRIETEYALLLNPDCQIEPEAVALLAQTLDAHPDVGIVAPQGWRNRTVPQKSWRPAFFRPQPAGRYQVPDQLMVADWLHGSCQLVRTQAFTAIGGFDPAFFLYYEDDDLCLRMQQAGWRCMLQPAAKALHPGGVSSAPSARTTFIKQFHYARSRQIALQRYVGGGAAFAHRARLLAAWIPATALYALLLRRQHASKWFGWGLAGLCAMFDLRGISSRIR
ncbi:glycosyltransferase family 2 protein [Stenotrophomonas tumulicola]|uniref:Glycosyltransferase family 2 protein n=1 Tax=Stenotrophomonas tumulicola TaxID=1685415 RepID=A0A7W3FKT1_9GAMM|nr:glycosyltransferase family 2 protein [Stenotrophomonas tumulicola]MBA8681399.1 glycosyltransferase family 2 protein [Stenotrophomonas tumulicola]